MKNNKSLSERIMLSIDRARKGMVVVSCLVALFLVLLLVTRLVGFVTLNHAPLVISKAEQQREPDGSVSIHLEGSGFQEDLKGLIMQEPRKEHVRLAQCLKGETIKALALRDDLLVVEFENTRVAVMRRGDDLSNTILGTLDLKKKISAIELVGERLLVGHLSDEGLSVVDVSDPSAPELISKVGGVSVASIACSGEFAYFVDTQRGLFRVSLDRLESSLQQLADLRMGWRLAVDNDRVAVGRLDGHVSLLELDSGGGVRAVGDLATKEGVRDLAFMGSYLLVATAEGLLRSWDMTRWPVPVEVDRLDLPGIPFDLLADRQSPEAFLSFVSSGLMSVAVGPDGRLNNQGRLHWTGTFLDMQRHDDHLYTIGSHGLEVFSVEEIDNRTETGLEYLSHHVDSLVKWQGDGYVQSGRSLIRVVEGDRLGPNVDEPLLALASSNEVQLYHRPERDSEVLVTSLRMQGPVTALLLDFPRLYLVVDGQMKTFDVSEPRQPVALGQALQTGRADSIRSIAPGFLGLAARNSGVLIVDVRHPENVEIVAQYVQPEHLRRRNWAKDLLAVGDFFVISRGEGGLEFVDFRDPFAPRTLLAISTPGIAGRMTLSGDLLLVAIGNMGAFAVDVSSPGQPEPIGAIPLPIRTKDILAVDDSLLIYSVPSGAYRVDAPLKIEGVFMAGDGRARVRLPDGPIAPESRLFLYGDGKSSTRHVAKAGVGGGS